MFEAFLHSKELLSSLKRSIDEKKLKLQEYSVWKKSSHVTELRGRVPASSFIFAPFVIWTNLSLTAITH